MIRVVGIDPGLHGAAAALEITSEGTIVSTRLLDMPRPDRVLDVALAATLVVLERQRASPQMGVRSAFLLGRLYGFWLGLLAAGPPDRVKDVEPAVWRGAFGLTSKAGGIAMAREVIGEPDLPLTHDEADAILLAWWGWRTVLSKAG